jgi:hypothetical protein
LREEEDPTTVPAVNLVSIPLLMLT